jgi:hypothetical protein
MAHSGQKTVTTAGTAVQMTSEAGQMFAIKGLSTNTGQVYLGNVSGDVASTNGFELDANEVVIIGAADSLVVVDLNQYWLDSAVNGEGVSWLKLA